MQIGINLSLTAPRQQGGGGPVGLPMAPTGYEYRRVVLNASSPVFLNSGQRVFALVPSYYKG